MHFSSVCSFFFSFFRSYRRARRVIWVCGNLILRVLKRLYHETFQSCTEHFTLPLYKYTFENAVAQYFCSLFLLFTSQPINNNTNNKKKKHSESEDWISIIYCSFSISLYMPLSVIYLFGFWNLQISTISTSEKFP